MSSKAKKIVSTSLVVIVDILIAVYVVLLAARLITGGFKLNALFFKISCTRALPLTAILSGLVILRVVVHMILSKGSGSPKPKQPPEKQPGGQQAAAVSIFTGSAKPLAFMAVIFMLVFLGSATSSLIYLKQRATYLDKNILAIRETLFNDMIDRATENATTDSERCIKLAEHIARYVTNAPGEKEDSIDRAENREGITSHSGVLRIWETRRGICGQRSKLLIEALKRENIKAQDWQIYDYGFGHACVQAYYDAAWHFFDPTYGGYFTGDDGHVLSWREIKASVNKGVMPRMVVFTPTLDKNNDGTRVDNHARMNSVYTLERLKAVRCAGARFSKVFNPPVYLDLAKMQGNQLAVGAKDGGSEDMRSAKVQEAVKNYYFDALGNYHDKFMLDLHFLHVPDTKSLRITFYFTDKGAGDGHLAAFSKTGRILEGVNGPVCSHTKKWTILYKPNGTDSNIITVGSTDFSKKNFCYLDNVVIERAL